MTSILHGPDHIPIAYLGPPIEAGALPAFFYFALSAEESLTLHPYNQPATLVAHSDLRVFAFTLPGHGAEHNKFHAMQYWAEQMAKGKYLLTAFFDQVLEAIQWLIDQKIVDPNHLAVGGLSRGGFVATHIAAKDPRIQTLLGIAPLTDLLQLGEFSSQPDLHRHADALNVIHLVDSLTHVRHVRFYIGNRDTRVSTDACYHFIRELAEKNYEKKARHQKIELMISQSIGQHGHGTSPSIFAEGAEWVKKLLLERDTNT